MIFKKKISAYINITCKNLKKNWCKKQNWKPKLLLYTVFHIVTVSCKKEWADSLGYFFPTVVAMILRTWEFFTFYFRFSIIF